MALDEEAVFAQDTTSQATREVTDKGDFIRINNVCGSKGATPPPRTEPEKRLANHISDKGPVPRIYKELLQINNKKPNNPS